MRNDMRMLSIGVLGIAVLSGCASAQSGLATAPLDGTAWVLASLPGRTLVAGQAATARFESGTVSGSDGCNRFSGPFEATSPAIAIGPNLVTTQMACEPQTMQQGQAFVTALTGAKRYRVAGGRLELLAADGTVLASFSAQSQSLAGTSWIATGINNGRQALVGVVAGSKVTLAFGADGKAYGSAGCNRYTTTFKADGPSLRFAPAAATRMTCADERVNEQERAFLKALATVATMRIEGERLELRTEAGALAATLDRGAR
jgi:heat shock protein HslJ